MATIVHWGKYYPPDRGGIESVTESVAVGAATAGHQVTVVCFTPGRDVSSETLDGVRVLRATRLALVASQPFGWRYFCTALGEGRRADLVHLHVPNMLAALAAAMLGRMPKLIVHWHSDVISKGMLGTLLQPLERSMLRRADLIVCTSQPYAEGSPMLRPFLHKVRTVPIGVADVPAQAGGLPALPSELADQIGRRRIILAIGRLVPYKGFDILVQAAARLPQDTLVVIVGSGPMQPDLRGRIAKLGMQDRVLLAGQLADSVLDALFRHSTLFCLPSVERSEAFGVVLVEAMAYGLPLVATQIAGSGVPWVNQHQESGLNVPVRDSAALAAACNEILASDALRERLAAGARKRYLELFMEQTAIERMLEVYRSVIAGA